MSTARPPRRKNYRKAMVHFRTLLRDKDDTAEVFRIFDALPAREFVRRARRFVDTVEGLSLRQSEPELPPILDDHAALRRLPRGSVGQAYVDFMEEERLTSAGLVCEQRRANERVYGDLLEWYGARERDTHDLLHVLTGYGRDALGEQCVLLFTQGQAPSPANLLLGYGGAWLLGREVRGRAPVYRAVREAHRAGRGKRRVSEMSIRGLLALDLIAARRALGIREPGWYRLCHAAWQQEGYDPRALLSRKCGG